MVFSTAHQVFCPGVTFCSSRAGLRFPFFFFRQVALRRSILVVTPGTFRTPNDGSIGGGGSSRKQTAVAVLCTILVAADVVVKRVLCYQVNKSADGSMWKASLHVQRK